MKETNPLISVIMPVYNSQSYLDKAISSVLNQTYKNLELILVDDDSKDNSFDICKNWAKKDERVKPFHMEQNGGAGKARNFGLDKAEGSYITFVDSDDTIALDLYEKVMGDSKGQYDLFIWGVTEEYYDESGNQVGTNQISLPDEVLDNQLAVRKKIIELENKTLFGYQWNHLYKASIIKDNNIYFEKVVLYEDFLFNLEVIKHVNTLKISSHKGYFYQKRANQSITHTYVCDYFELSKRRIESLYSIHKEWGVCTKKVVDCLGQRYLRYSLSALVRNNDAKAHMTHRDKRNWVKKLYNDTTFRGLVNRCSPDSLVMKILRAFYKIKWTEGCLLMGKVVYIVKEKIPKLYTKKGQIH